MILAALPFVRYVQLLNGNTRSIWTDPQIRAFLGTIAVLVLFMWAELQRIFRFASSAMQFL